MTPFPGGIEADANATLLFSLAAAVIYAFTAGWPPSLMRSAAKTLAILLLAALAFRQGGPPLLAVALLLSSAGDALLSRDGEQAFLGGLAGFFLAHVAYIALFGRAGGGVEAILSQGWRAGLAALVVVVAAVMLGLLWNRVGAALRWPVAAYAAAIFVMGLAALSMDNPAVIAGAVLFIASDAILASEKFLVTQTSPQRVWMRHAVWISYYAAQLAITLGFLLRQA